MSGASFAFKNILKSRKSKIAAGLVAATGATMYLQANQSTNTNTNSSSSSGRSLIRNDDGSDSLSQTYLTLLMNKEKPKPPSRTELLSRLSENEENDTVNDVLIIGGGATGTASAVDAITRDPSLKVVLVEMNDFSSGTSSKSTKMIHGGIRYLEKAFFQLSKAQLDLVIEALNERQHMISTAPHLCSVLPIMIPIYQYWQVPYFYAGTKMYDIFSGFSNLKSSYLLSSSNALAACPMLDEENLKAGIVYHDGSFNDSRMNVSLATTAIEKGATVLNYMEVEQLLKNPTTGKVEGCVAKDLETGKTYNIKSKTVVNATGPFSDRILNMDNDPEGLPKDTEMLKLENDLTDGTIGEKIAVVNPKMVIPSAGVHIILPSYYCPSNLGLLDAKTSDGRVMFFLPWQNKVLAGTTDIPLKNVPATPTATEADIQDILKELQHYIKFPVRREDVLSAWSGIRPLAQDPRTLSADNKGGKTESIVRSHFLFTSDNGLITIAAGKWTTVYAMAQETIDEVIKQLYGDSKVKPCNTKDLKLSGAENYSPNLPALLSQEYGISSSLAEHLSNNYGTNSSVICEMFKQNPNCKLPIEFASPKPTPNYEAFEYPFTIAELKYAMDYEYARTPLDFLLRRTRFGFLDAKQALKAVDGTVDIMAKQFHWDSKKKQHEIQYTVEYLKSFGV